MPLKKGTGLVVCEPNSAGGTDLSYYVFYEKKTFHPMAPIAPFMFGRQLGGGLDNLAEHFGGRRLD